MTLAAPTGLQVQLLEPLLDIQQNVKRTNAPLTAIEFDQYVAEWAVTLTPERTLLELTQRVTVFVESAQRQLLAIEQDVKRTLPARTLLTLRQWTRSPAVTLETLSAIFLDGADITARCSPAIEVSASEGSNRTAVVIYRPPSGPINISGFQGRSLEIRRLISGQWVPIFTGSVDVPRYDREQRTIRLQGSDLRGERLGRANRQTLRNLTGGLFSPVTQREDASGEAWVRELLKTVEGSLDYTGAGNLRYRPWAVGTPRYTLTADQIHHREIRLEFATRSEIVNRMAGRLEYRHYQRNTFSHSIQIGMRGDGRGLPRLGDTMPPREALRSAVFGAGWNVVDYQISGLPRNGWYRLSPTDRNPTSFFASDAVRKVRARGVSATLERYISQPKREVYEILVTAPESVDQFGEIDGSDMRFAVETRVDPSIFEERGCVIIQNPDDRRGDVNLALQCMQRMAAKTIRAGHRQNTAAFRYKPSDGDLLPLEIGDTVTVSNSEITATGFVAELRHVVTREHDRYTDVRLALSRVDSPVTVTENWTLPAPPSQYRLSETAQPTMTPDCPLPADAVTADGESRIEPDGTVYVVTPSIDRRDVDEIVGTRAQQYSVAIPRDTFTVEVPE